MPTLERLEFCGGAWRGAMGRVCAMLVGGLLAACGSLDDTLFTRVLSSEPEVIAKATFATIGATSCDRLAGIEEDGDRELSLQPVSSAQLDAQRALAACEADLRLHPHHPRLLVQQARVLHALDRHAQAFAVVREAAAQGYPYAAFLIGQNFQAGRGVAPDGQQALSWYRKAAALGYARAWERIGDVYHTGRLVPKDDRRSVEAFRRGAKAGEPGAMAGLAAVLKQSGERAEALQWARRLAEQDHLTGMNIYGVMLVEDRHHDQSWSWFQRTAARGDATGMFNVGMSHLHGWGVPRNPALAAQWFRQAAERKHVGASLRLATMYATGEGVPRNEREAMRWYGALGPRLSIDAASP